jgi:hypothetical protein
MNAMTDPTITCPNRKTGIKLTEGLTQGQRDGIRIAHKFKEIARKHNPEDSQTTVNRFQGYVYGILISTPNGKRYSRNEF